MEMNPDAPDELTEEDMKIIRTTLELPVEVNGQTVPFRLLGKAPQRSCFFVGVAKSGSTLMHRLVEDLCEITETGIINISDTCFLAGIPERKIPEVILPALPDKQPAFYYGFRCIGNLKKSHVFRTSPKIYLVRDPRDSATSLFFSMQKSHQMPKEGLTEKIIREQREMAGRMDINEFIQGGAADFIFTALEEIRQQIWLPETNLFRYEDIIFKKSLWIATMCRIAGISVSDDDMAELLKTHDIVPSAENPAEHIRQVAPGNFRNHLSDDTIRYIEAKTASAMAAFNYSER